MKRQYWQEWTSLVLGVWLFVSPLMLSFLYGGNGSADGGTVNFVVLGLAVAALAGAGLYMHRLWEDWVTLALGLWMMISPQVLGFSHQFAASADATVVGIFLVGLALSEMYRDVHSSDGSDGMAH